jgi:hypothetical protein
MAQPESITEIAIESILKDNGLRLVTFEETINGFDVTAVTPSTGKERHLLLPKTTVEMAEGPLRRGEPPYRVKLPSSSRRRRLPSPRRIRRQ